MEDRGHVDVDTLAAYLLGALDAVALRRVEVHLATGCLQCRAEQEWTERLLSLARTDQSVEPPSFVLARAIRIMPVAQSSLPSGDTFLRRLRALPIFDSLGGVSLAGARGAGGSTRQVLYAVDDLNLEIDLQVRRQEARRSLDVHGQLFPPNETLSVAGLPVMLVAAGDARETLTSALGAFHLEVPEDAALLLLRLPDCAIEVPVPQP